MVLSIEVLSIFAAAVIPYGFSQLYHARDVLAATDICLELHVGKIFMEHCQPLELVSPPRSRGSPKKEYAVPVHADSPGLDVVFVEEHDPHVNPLDVKGVGEIAMIGVGPVITNAIYHATGKRIRDLPLTPDKLL